MTLHNLIKEFEKKRLEDLLPNYLLPKLESFRRNEAQCYYYSLQCQALQQQINQCRLFYVPYPPSIIDERQPYMCQLQDCQIKQFYYFHSMCCDAKDICGSLLRNGYNQTIPVTF